MFRDAAYDRSSQEDLDTTALSTNNMSLLCIKTGSIPSNKLNIFVESYAYESAT
jgi:hypothetical protein